MLATHATSCIVLPLRHLAPAETPHIGLRLRSCRIARVAPECSFAAKTIDFPAEVIATAMPNGTCSR